MTCCLPGSSPTRHFYRREDPGDEVVHRMQGLNARLDAGVSPHTPYGRVRLARRARSARRFGASRRRTFGASRRLSRPTVLQSIQRWPLRVFRLGIVSSLFLINNVIVFDTGYIKKVAEILLRRFLQRSGQKGNVWYHFDGK